MLQAVIIIILVAGLFMGWRKGVVQLTASLLGIIGGIVVSLIFGSMLAEAFLSIFSSPKDISPMSLYTATIIARILLFIVVVVLVSLLGQAIKTVIHLALLGFLDRLLGAIGGVIETAILLSIGLNLWLVCSPPQPAELERYAQQPVIEATLSLVPNMLGAGEEYQNLFLSNEGMSATPTGD